MKSRIAFFLRPRKFGTAERLKNPTRLLTRGMNYIYRVSNMIYGFMPVSAMIECKF